MKASTLSRQPAFIYFWLGVLTGAILVLASLMIRTYVENGSASVLSRTPARVQIQTVNPTNTRSMGPNMMGPNMNNQKSGTTSMGPNMMGPNMSGY